MVRNEVAAQERAAFLNMRECCLRLFRPECADAKQIVEGLAAVEWRLRRMNSESRRGGGQGDPARQARRSAHLKLVRQTALEMLRELQERGRPEPFLRTLSGDFYHYPPW
jgi:hypothetical protein